MNKVRAKGVGLPVDKLKIKRASKIRKILQGGDIGETEYRGLRVSRSERRRGRVEGAFSARESLIDEVGRIA